MLDSCVCRLKLYAPFVDDYFAVFNNDSSLDFLNLLNSKHKFAQFYKIYYGVCITMCFNFSCSH